MKDKNGLTYIGTTNFRNTNLRLGIKDNDRLAHIYIIGKTGVGKSTLIKNMVLSDIRRGNGCCLIDPHGDLATGILKQIPQGRKNDLIYFDPRNVDNPIAYNPLHGVAPKHHHLVASGLLSTFKKIWADSWGVRLEYILRYSLLTLLWFPEATLLHIQPLLTDRTFREMVLQYVDDKAIVSFWQNEFDKYSPRLRAEAISPILNKTGLFISSLPLRKIFGQKVSSFKMQHVLDSGKILIANLSKGEIGEDASSLLGCLLVSAIMLAAMHRASVLEEQRKPFYVYIDECHSFMTQAIVDVLAESRKFKLSLCMGSQYLSQVSEPIRNAIFGNVGTLICFLVGSEDASFLQKELFPIFNEQDLINLPKYSIFIKLMIDGATSAPFSANTFLE